MFSSHNLCIFISAFDFYSWILLFQLVVRSSYSWFRICVLQLLLLWLLFDSFDFLFSPSLPLDLCPFCSSAIDYDITTWMQYLWTSILNIHNSLFRLGIFLLFIVSQSLHICALWTNIEFTISSTKFSGLSSYFCYFCCEPHHISMSTFNRKTPACNSLYYCPQCI